MLIKLALKSNEHIEIVIANTHLLYNPKRNDVRLAQTQLLLAEIENFSRIQKKSTPTKYLPILIMGDFNFSNYSNPYHLLLTGRLDNPSQILPPESGVTSNCVFNRNNNKWNNNNYLTHPLKLESVYPNDNKERATTMHHKWISVDHMFYSRDVTIHNENQYSLELLARLLTPLALDCQKIGPIPNQFHGSDHYYVAANFLINFTKS